MYAYVHTYIHRNKKLQILTERKQQKNKQKVRHTQLKNKKTINLEGVNKKNSRKKVKLFRP